ncbi:hypothetical protein AB0I60_17930 [Actinosynnema sp. NPDC050436]|uniref:hypothetical protein n=1 Tax=Actinosynnema sp. NPDC050436 TaxID=3155659 RepID=UPI0033E5C190
MREDLNRDLPPIDEPLDEIDHPLIKKGNEQFAEPTGPRERIRSIDDIVVFKVKVQRWRESGKLEVGMTSMKRLLLMPPPHVPGTTPSTLRP